jgi:SLT domain-containing protein
MPLHTDSSQQIDMIIQIVYITAIRYNHPTDTLHQSDIVIQKIEGKNYISESNPWEDKGNNHVPPNRRIGQPKSLARFTP